MSFLIMVDLFSALLFMTGKKYPVTKCPTSRLVLNSRIDYHFSTHIHNIIYYVPIIINQYNMCIRGYVYGSYKIVLLVYNIRTVSPRSMIVCWIYVQYYHLLLTCETALHNEKTDKVDTVQKYYIVNEPTKTEDDIKTYRIPEIQKPVSLDT